MYSFVNLSRESHHGPLVQHKYICISEYNTSFSFCVLWLCELFELAPRELSLRLLLHAYAVY
jgi:hypothetical protein